MAETIVSFAAPPVVEVVAGVAFESPDSNLSALLSAFWKEHLRAEFPILQQQPPYSPPVEQFAVGAAGPSLTFEFGTATFPAPRLWALSHDGRDLLQLQPGYFACNWRKVQPDGKYDRWSKRRESFEHWYSMLSEFLSSEGSGQPKVTQCEVTYINHIKPGAQWRDHTEFGRVFRISLSLPISYAFEQASVQTQSILVEEDEPFGRLHVKLFPAYDRDGRTPLYVLELTARGAPKGDGTPGALTFMDKGRDAIDNMFVEITTPEMHEEWGMQR